MYIKEKIERLLNIAFRDEVVAISGPHEWWWEYRDVGKRLEGYLVVVKYKYAGEKKYHFTIDNDHLQLVSANDALKNAKDFYSRVCAKIQQNGVKANGK